MRKKERYIEGDDVKRTKKKKKKQSEFETFQLNMLFYKQFITLFLVENDCDLVPMQLVFEIFNNIYRLCVCEILFEKGRTREKVYF